MTKKLEDQTELETETALAEISEDLFGQGNSPEEPEATQTEEEPGAGEVSAVADPEVPAPRSGEAPAEESSQEVQDLGAPKTWTKEAVAEWATIKPRIQQEILKREQDFLNGISQYKSGAELGQRYDSVVEPYRGALEAENIDPVQLFQSFAANHYLLSRGTPEQKIQLAASLITGYGVDFAKLTDFLGSNLQEPVDPTVAALQKEVNELKAAREQQLRQDHTALENRVLSEIEEFAKDPAHPHFDELVDDIQKLLASGYAANLQEAYDKAVYANPATRAKALEAATASQQAAKEAAEKARMDKLSRVTSADLKTSQTPRDGTVQLGSLDDTLEETMRAIAART